MNLLRKHFNKRALINPAKRRDKYAPDLIVEGYLADLKTQNTPFFTADRYHVDPQFAVTFNRKDFERYKEFYPQIHIYFWLEWQETEGFGYRVRPMTAIFGVTFRELVYFIGFAPEHHYERRKEGAGTNGKSSFVLDVRHFKQILLIM